MNKQKISFLLTEIMISAILLSRFSINLSVAQTIDAPVHIHLTWQQSNMSTAITVTWQSANSTSGSSVRYGLQSGVYNYSVNGEVYAGGSGFIHNANLTGLLPDMVYYFVCGGNTSGWSIERKFRTAPIHPTSVRFVTGGDSRSNPTARDQVSSTMRTFNPSFVLFSGDAVNIGANQSEWDSFFDSVDSLWIDSNNFTIPIIPCLGNHEMYGPTNYTQTNYYDQFALPGNEQWFSLNWGDLLHIVVLNSQTNITGDELTWLTQDLAANKNYPWKIISFHQPIYTTGQDPARPDEGVAWGPLFDQYHVQVVVAGHNHMYERFKPIYNNATVSSYTNATMYITSGGWGAPLYSVGNSSWFTPWLASANSTYSFTVMDASNNGTLDCKAIDTQKQVFDQVTLTTTVIPEFPLFISPLSLELMTVATLVAVSLRKKRDLSHFAG